MFTRISLGQYIPGESVMHKLDPRTKMLLVAAFMTAVFTANTNLQLVLLAVTCLIIVLLSRINISLYLQGVKPFWFIILVTVLAQIILTGGSTFIDLQILKISGWGFTTGAAIGIRLVLILLMAQLLSITTTPMALTGSLEKLLKPLSRVGFPVQETVMIMNISLRFIPLFIEEADRISKAQMGRGADFKSRNISKRIRNIISILVPLFTGAFKRANDLARAMEARCYTGGERTSLYELRLAGKDYLVMAITIIWAVLVSGDWFC
ncbi:MAG TPA: energy-coupling factor transporter transmembrane component T [Syntrophomonadaceae bacterium]|nr:energy-coupling factor transporter transmembrane component T [Syntrophomonadaceae bacterium]